jgi:hypothetical protein
VEVTFIGNVVNVSGIYLVSNVHLLFERHVVGLVVMCVFVNLKWGEVQELNLFLEK